jgi:hypothetical protein
MGKKSTKKAPAKKKPLAVKVKEQRTGNSENEAAPAPLPVDSKTLQAHADMLIAEVSRMRVDTVPADVQAAVRSLRKWRSA